ncbi:MAG: nuclear transport factor 2 family protein [Thiohalospira sp.]
MSLSAPSEPREGRAIRTFFEGLTPAGLDELGGIYAEGARFRDPFNEVEGIAAIRRIFADMFEQAPDARFNVREVVGAAPLLYVRWGFTFTPGRAREPWSVEGVSRLALDGEGRIVDHIDYWDPAAGIYERLPLLGPVLRWVRRRLAVD